ncbi:MAG: hypothetical protein ACW98Y_12480 [Candidatus Thorarchaeota archaeon]|jgi:hypothetical protein
MIDDNVQRTMELIGIDLKDGRSKVLRAIITSQSEMGIGCTFDELRSALMEATGSKDVARPLIYRYLKSLEENKLIRVDRAANPNLYLVDITTIAQGLDSIKDVKIENLEIVHEKLRRTLSTLSTIDASWLARDLIEMLVGAPFESGSRYTHGERQIHELIGSEIYSRARKGDLVRVTLDWDFHSGGSEDKKRELGQTLFAKGIKMRFLLHNPNRVDQELLIDRIQEYRMIRSSPVKDLAETRVTYKDTKTYQSIALNRDGIVLIVSEDPYTAVWVPRTVNSKLVDDVIDSYDEDFDSGIDLLEMEV